MNKSELAKRLVKIAEQLVVGQGLPSYPSYDDDEDTDDFEETVGRVPRDKIDAFKRAMADHIKNGRIVVFDEGEVLSRSRFTRFDSKTGKQKVELVPDNVNMAMNKLFDAWTKKNVPSPKGTDARVFKGLASALTRTVTPDEIDSLQYYVRGGLIELTLSEIYVRMNAKEVKNVFGMTAGELAAWLKQAGARRSRRPLS